MIFGLNALILKFKSHNKFLDGFSFFRQADTHMKTEHDHKLIRCPKLGDEMTFAYCLQEAGDLPCARTINCWQTAFDAAALLQELLPPGDWERFTGTQPKDKVTSLIEIFEKAKRQK